MSAAEVRQDEVANAILASLPAPEFDALAPWLERVSVATGKTLFEVESAPRRVYFVESGLLSLIATLEDGTSIEVAALGREGLAGLVMLLGADAAVHTAHAQIGGHALCMRLERAREAFRRLPAFQSRVLAYTRMLMAHVTQTAACNTLHTVEQRLARWLLMCSRRTESDTIPLTQEYLSHMLGVRRSGVTVAVGELERAGFITHSRGTVVVTYTEGLRGVSCECIRLLTDEFEDFVREGLAAEKSFESVPQRTDPAPRGL
ncbi:MAG TPA: Crp/Fnr family transcriptional regulator [Pyrinomonadaceae bacterium]|jgi:CRP-like cAMP-binding protein|nr:Crp/Fnr family transcriptional regulator [Pyrinomonadaceae bacterium]